MSGSGRSRTRRGFLRMVAAAGLAGAAAPATLLAQAKPGTAAKKAKSAKPAPAPPPPAANAPPPPSEDALALTAIVRRRYGAHLTDEQLAGVTREFEQRLTGGKALRAAPLANGDEPDTTFHA